MSFCQKNGIILLYYHLLTIQKENDGSTRDIFSFAGLVLFFRSTFLSYCRDIEIFEAHTHYTHKSLRSVQIYFQLLKCCNYYYSKQLYTCTADSFCKIIKQILKDCSLFKTGGWTRTDLTFSFKFWVISTNYQPHANFAIRQASAYTSF